jgi:hypothetical protein
LPRTDVGERFHDAVAGVFVVSTGVFGFEIKAEGGAFRVLVGQADRYTVDVVNNLFAAHESSDDNIVSFISTIGVESRLVMCYNDYTTDGAVCQQLFEKIGNLFPNGGGEKKKRRKNQKRQIPK